MKTHIALLRGINVGGRGKLPMKQLASLLQQLGCENVATYIQSGNAVFRCAAADAKGLAGRLQAAIEKWAGFAPRVLILEAKALEKAVAANPYPMVDAEPTSLHLFFLADKPKKPDFDAMLRVKIASEQFALQGKVFYLFAPEGFGTSKLAAGAEKWLGVDATARNWRTVCALAEMAKSRD